MVGGENKAFESAKPYLELMGRRVVHCGAPGNGLYVEIAISML
jgi:3-hydroxyisobutyrate dehydrogenase